MSFVVGMGVPLGALAMHYGGLRAAVLTSVPLIAPTLYKIAGIAFGFYDLPMRKLVVPGRQTAIRKGDFVVFHIGAAPNRKIDSFFKWMGDAMSEIQLELEEHPEYGCLGTENYVGTTGTLAVQYWESLEALNAYARNSGNRHKSPWAKLMKMGKEKPDYGFWHETFLVKDGSYETIYVNCPPMLLGNARGVTLEPCRGKYQSAAGRSGLSDGSDYPTHIGAPNY